jgi:streptogramin lyase
MQSLFGVRQRAWKSAAIAVLMAASALTVVSTTAVEPAAAAEPDLTTLCGATPYTPVGLVGDTALGPDGNIWFTDVTGIGRTTPSGQVTMFGKGLALGDLTSSIAAGTHDDLWFIQRSPVPKIGRITTAGVITTFTDGIPADSKPLDITAGPDGNMWFTDQKTNEIARITPAGVVTRFAVGADHTPLGAIITGPDDNLWFMAKDAIGRMTTSGDVTMFTEGLAADSIVVSLTIGPDHNLWFTDIGRVGRITTDGTITEFDVPAAPDQDDPDSKLPVTDIVTDPDGGGLLFTEYTSGRLGRVTTDGVVSIVGNLTVTFSYPGAGSPGVPPDVTLTKLPRSLTLGADGNIWLIVGGDAGVAGIGRMTTEGVVTSVLGSAVDLPINVAVDAHGTLWYTGINLGGVGYVTRDGFASFFPVPGFTSRVPAYGIAIGPDGNVWFTSPDGDSVSRLTPEGKITHFTDGITPGSAPTNIVAGHDGNLWFAESSAKRIGRITPTGVVTEFSAGTAGFPGSIAVAKNGDLWFTEGEAGVSRGIGRITPAGQVTEFDVDISDDSTIADIAGGPDGNVWFTDANARIGRITPAGDVTFYDVPGNYDVKKVNRIAAVGDDLWFTVMSYNSDQSSYDLAHSLGRITTDGEITLTDTTPANMIDYGDIPLVGADLVVGAPDGELWYTRQSPVAIVTHASVPDAIGDPCNHDEDNDTHLDWADAFPNDPTEWVDTDSDGIGNNADPDDDNDGLADTKDPKPLDPDGDGDGVKDGVDNCVLKVNANQADSDHDGIGDVCDRTVVLKSVYRSGRTLHATLKDSAGHAVAGVNLTFSVYGGAKVCRVRTNSAGQAKCTAAKRFSAKLSRGYRATFAGDALHNPVTVRTWPTLAVSTKTVRHGAAFRVTATGLKPGMRATIWVAGKRAYVGHADAKGVVRREVSFTAGTPAGTRRVRVSGYLKTYKKGGYYDRGYTVFTSVKYLKR